MVDICRATKRQGKYLPLFTDTEVNNCVSTYQPVNRQHQKVPLLCGMIMMENLREKS